MSKKIKREFLKFADDEDIAFEIAETYWAQGEKNITVAKVSQMLDPPITAHKYVVLRIIEL